jgi:hypothetical protein
VTTPAVVVAALDDTRGGRVEFYKPADEGEIAIGIGAQYPAPPPVTGEFVMSHDPIEVFLAVAPLDTPVPLSLREAYPALRVQDDRDTRVRLRGELAAQLAAFPVRDEPMVRSGSCSNAFIAWFDDVYRDMPGGETATCSTQGGDAYNNQGAIYGSNLPATYPITDDDPCSPYVNDCDQFTASFRDWNFGFENVHGNFYGQQANRHNMHTGLATCAGTATFHREWGGSAWDIDISTGGGWHTYVGRFPYNIGPAAELQWGLWQAGHPKKNARSEIKNNAANGDRVIWCGNFEDQWNVADTGCHNWCDLGPDACGTCFKL